MRLNDMAGLAFHVSLVVRGFVGVVASAGDHREGSGKTGKRSEDERTKYALRHEA